MVYNAERDKRDLATRDFHDERSATGEWRILARGNDAELYSYAMEECGVLHAGPGRAMTTLWGGWLFGVAILALLVYFARNLQIEWRAHKLRKEHALSTPTDATVLVGPNKN